LERGDSCGSVPSKLVVEFEVYATAIISRVMNVFLDENGVDLANPTFRRAGVPHPSLPFMSEKMVSDRDQVEHIHKLPLLQECRPSTTA
jgi:hypothetical protein